MKQLKTILWIVVILATENVIAGEGRIYTYRETTDGVLVSEEPIP